MTLNLFKVNDTYFDKLFREEWADADDIKGKVLLVDHHTMAIISMCYTQSQLLQQDIILIELIENHGALDLMKHLNCIVYVKPVAASLDSLAQELHNPHFHRYKVFFNNVVNKNQLEKMAESDRFEVVSSVVELFQDYRVVNDNLFVVSPSSVIEESNKLISVLLSVKKFPVIKFENNSISVKKLSSELLYQINSNLNNNLFENCVADVPPILLVCDRDNDPVTPLMSPWTYQSMMHELIGISKNMVEVGGEKLLLSEQQDDFFKESVYLNYGDLTELFQKKVEVYKRESNNHNLKTSNLVELKKILTQLPDFKKKSANVLKHLNIISELDAQILKQNLWEIGELQQSIMCNLEGEQYLTGKMTEILQNRSVPLNQKVKLVLIYSIRFKELNLNRFLVILNDSSFTDPAPSMAQVKLMTSFHKTFKNYKLQETATQDNHFKNFFKNFNNNQNHSENDNIYLQYKPQLQKFLESFIAAPHTIGGEVQTLVPDTLAATNSVQDIVIYIKGGVTYEEARVVKHINDTNHRVNLVIGGDGILNSNTWLDHLCTQVN